MQWSLGAAVATLPLQTGLLVYQTLWGRGFINPYTSIWLSLSECFLLISAFCFFFHCRRNKKRIQWGDEEFFNLFLYVLLIAGVSLLLSPFKDYIFNFFLFAKLLELLLFYILIVNRVLRARDILKIFIYSMSLQSALAILQVLFQGDLGLQLLGEPVLTKDTAHLARFVFGESSLIRAYGTMPHPNILGGYLVVSLITSLLYEAKNQNERIGLMALQFLGLMATFSRSAILALIIALSLLTLWYLKHIKKSVPIIIGSIFTLELLILGAARGFNILQDSSWSERITGYKQAWSMFLEQPLGVGLNHYTLFLDGVSQSTLMPWEYQPVHNVFMLGLTEMGILGGIILLLTSIYTVVHLYQKRKKWLTHAQKLKKRLLLTCFISFFIIGSFDHYLLSLDKGRFLVVLILAIIARFIVNPREVLPIKKGEPIQKILADQA